MSSNAFHQLYYHITWTTSSREALLDLPMAAWLEDTIRREGMQRGANILARKVMPEHVHLFVNLDPKVTPADFIGKMKGVTAHHFNVNYRD